MTAVPARRLRLPIPPPRLISRIDAVETSRATLYCPCLADLAPQLATLVGLLPIHDANGRLLEGIAEASYIPPEIYACVLALDPFRRMEDILRRLRAAGVGGIANFPTVAIIDGTMRATLDDLHMGFEQEVQLIELAQSMNLRTAGVVASADQAQRMIRAGSRVLVAAKDEALAVADERDGEGVAVYRLIDPCL